MPSKNTLGVMVNIRRPLKRAVFYASAMSPLEPPPIRFFIYAQGRTGSTLLSDLIDSHPLVKCEDEILGSSSSFIYPAYYALGRSKVYDCKAYGFHVKLSHIIEDNQIRNPKDWVEEMYSNGWNIIFLKRKDTIRHAYSHISSEKTDIWHSKESIHSNGININPEKISNKIRVLEERSRIEEETLSDIEYVKVVYEEHLLKKDKWQDTCNRIFNYMGLDKSKVETHHRKVNNGDLKNLIINYEEVSEYLKNKHNIYID